MFSFFKRAVKPQNSFEFIGVDMHNHLTPGIDDGSPDVATSMQLMEGMMQLGFKSFISTPHVISDVHPNTPQTITSAWKTLQQSVQEAQWPVRMGVAAEYMLNYDFDGLLANDELLTFGKKQVLIEMSYAVESPNLKEAIFALLTKGYKPILAHPERYNYYHRRFGIYEEITDFGCELQINLLSLGGYYGKAVKNVAQKLIDKKLINWLGTDLHHTRHLDALVKLSNNRKALEYCKKIKGLRNPGISI
ncbi:MAG: histidinol phosphatase [Bacteroidetes bacterium]|nr:MAG: histidinol phosphatase [Bacteroidota bacterium]